MKRKLFLSIAIWFIAFGANAQWTLGNNGVCNPGVFSLAFIGSDIFDGNNSGI